MGTNKLIFELLKSEMLNLSDTAETVVDSFSKQKFWSSKNHLGKNVIFLLPPAFHKYVCIPV